MSHPAESNPAFSKRTGCLHAAVVTIVFVLTLGVASAVRQRDPEAAGELAGRLLLLVAPLGFFASYLYQRGHKLWASSLVVSLWVAFPTLIFISRHRIEVTDAEKRGLEVLPDRIHDADFGFALPNPGQAFHLADLPSKMAAVLTNEPVGRESFAWMLRKDDSSEVVVVFLLKQSTVADENGFRRFTDAVRGRFTSLKGVKLLEDTVVWTPAAHEYRVAVRTESGLFGKLRCLASSSRPSVTVCVHTWASEPNQLDFVRLGLTFERPPAR